MKLNDIEARTALAMESPHFKKLMPIRCACGNLIISLDGFMRSVYLDGIVEVFKMRCNMCGVVHFRGEMPLWAFDGIPKDDGWRQWAAAAIDKAAIRDVKPPTGLSEHGDRLLEALIDLMLTGDPEVRRCIINGYVPPLRWTGEAEDGKPRWVRITTGVAADPAPDA